jgi:hypothetical protein
VSLSLYEIDGLRLHAEISRDTADPDPQPGGELRIEFTRVILFPVDDRPGREGTNPDAQGSPPRSATRSSRVDPIDSQTI